MILADARRALLSGCFILAFAGAASAHPNVHVEAPVWAAAAAPASKHGPRIAFDWFSNAAKAAPIASQADIVRAADRRRLGSGSWICSPAGGGSTSSCFER